MVDYYEYCIENDKTIDLGRIPLYWYRKKGTALKLYDEKEAWNKKCIPGKGCGFASTLGRKQIGDFIGGIEEVVI